MHNSHKISHTERGNKTTRIKNVKFYTFFNTQISRTAYLFTSEKSKLRKSIQMNTVGSQYRKSYDSCLTSKIDLYTHSLVTLSTDIHLSVWIVPKKSPLEHIKALPIRLNYEAVNRWGLWASLCVKGT
jgi:hypothetical protein